MNTRYCFTSILSGDMDKYLQYKRALKRKYQTEEGVLRLLDGFLIEHNVTSLSLITPQMIEVFLASRPRHRPRSYNHLLGVTRCFFDWLVVQECIDVSPVQARARRATAQQQPFLFDVNLAKRLLSLAAALPDRPKGPGRGKVYHLIFAMMYSLGLRVGEVSRLCYKDVDLNRQLLKIQATKFAKDRLVPFGPRLGRQLEDYLKQKDRNSYTLQPDQPLFSFCVGRPIHPCTITQTFHHLVTQNDFTVPSGVAPPKLHCLRHSFAVGTLLRWYRTGIDPGQRLIQLSTFLGHVDPASTAWYLTITDELLTEANKRFEKIALPTLGRVNT
jgi:site-specific recombinase XerD